MVWIRQILWTDRRIDHIARHGVDPLEAEDIVFGDRLETKARDHTYRLIGQTSGGRYLPVFIAPTSTSGVYVVATARDATIQERRLFQRR